MVKRKTTQERLKEIEEQKLKLLERERELKKKLTNEKRNARTRRLIQLGALTEKFFNIEEITPDEYEKFLRVVCSFENVKTAINNHKSRVGNLESTDSENSESTSESSENNFENHQNDF